MTTPDRHRRLTIRPDGGPELLYVRRNGQAAYSLGRDGVPADLDALDRQFLGALCLHVLDELGERHAHAEDDMIATQIREQAQQVLAQWLREDKTSRLVRPDLRPGTPSNAEAPS